MSKAPDGERRSFGERILGLSSHYIQIDENIANEAKRYQQLGIKPWDSLHLASAVAASAHYFCSCDDELLKKAQAASTGLTQVVSVIELVNQLKL